MSRTIDERVVSMKFDNKQFEANVKTSLSTLSKLKQSLKMEGAVKGLQDLDKAAKNISLDGIAAGVDALQQSFSAMGVVGRRVLENLTDTAMNFASRAIGFVTNTITQGGIKRAMNIENAHFQLQGLLKDEEAVQAVMSDAMDSVDGTAYAYDSAAKAASQFAASGMRAGAEMQSALRAITGVAAMTNSEYEDISRVFTTVAGNGRLMGDQLLQLSSRGLNAAATLADYMTRVGNGAKVTEADIREMVSKGQISFQLFAAAMDDAFGEHAKKANETFTGAFSNVKAALGRIGAEFISPLIVQNGPLVELFNALRVRINEIKVAIIPCANAFTKSVTKMANAATNMLKGSSAWDKLAQKVSDAGVPVDTFKEKLMETAREHGIAIDDMVSSSGSFEKSLKEGWLTSGIISETIKKFIDDVNNTSDAIDDVTDKVEYFNDVVKRVIRGDFGTGQARVEALTEAGYDQVAVQTLVNKIWERNGHTWDDCSLSAEEIAETIAGLSAEELKSIGYTEEQIEALKDLAKQAEETGTPISELMAAFAKPSKKELLVDTLSNSIKTLKAVLGTVAEAWKEVFAENKSDLLYELIKAVHGFSESIVPTEKQLNSLKNALKGVFSIVKALLAIASTVVRVGSKLLGIVLKPIGNALLTLSGYLGQATTAFLDFSQRGISKAAGKLVEFYTEVKNTSFVQGVMEKISSGLKVMGDAFEAVRNEIGKIGIGSLSDNLNALKTHVVNVGKAIYKQLKRVYEYLDRNAYTHKIIEKLTDAFAALKKTVSGFKMPTADGILSDFQKLKEYLAEKDYLCTGIDMIAGSLKYFAEVLYTKVGSFASTAIGQVVEWGKKGLGGLKEVAGVFRTIPAAAGGVKESVGGAWDSIKEFFGNFASAFSLDKILDVGKSLAQIAVLYELYKALKNFADLPKTIASSIKALADTIKSYQKVDTKSETFKNLAISVGIIAASIFLLAQLDWKEAWKAAVAVGSIIVLLGGIQIALSALGKRFKDVNTTKITIGIASLCAGVLLLTIALKRLEGVKWEDMGAGLLMLVIMLAELTGATVAIQAVGGKAAASAITILALTIALGKMVSVLKAYSKLKLEDVKDGLKILGWIAGGLTVFMGVVGGLSKGSDMLGAAATLIAIMVSLKLLKGVLEEYASMNTKGMGGAIAAIITIVVGLTVVMAIIGESFKDTGFSAAATLLAFAFAIGHLAKAVAALGSMDIGSLLKGVGAVAALTIALVVFADELKDIPKGSFATVAALAAGLLVLSAAAIVLGLLPWDVVKQGVLAVVTLVVALGGALKLASKMDKTAVAGILVMTIALATCVASLLFLADVPWQQLLIAAGCLAGLMLALAGTMVIVKKWGSLDAGKALLMAAGGILAIAVALRLLAGFNLGELSGGLGALAAALLATTLALYVINEYSSAEAGTTLLMAAAGILAIAFALKMVASIPTDKLIAAGVALGLLFAVLIIGAAVCKKFVVGAAALTGVLLGIAAIILSIGVTAWLISQAFKTFAEALDLVGVGLTSIGEGIRNLITSVASCKDNVGIFADVLGKFGEAILGIVINIAASMVTLAVALWAISPAIIAFSAALIVGSGAIIAFSVALAIGGAGVAILSLGLTAFAEAIVLVTAALGSLSEAITTLKGVILGSINDFVKIGKYLIEGFIKGIKSMISKVVDTAKNLVKNVVGTVRKCLGINSPSKEMMELGEYSGEGFAIGLDNSSGMVEESSSNLAGLSLDSFDLKSQFGSMADGNIGSYMSSMMGSSGSVSKGSSDVAGASLGSFDLGSQFGSMGDGNIGSYVSGMSSSADNSEEEVTKTADKLTKPFYMQDKFTGAASGNLTAYTTGMSESTGSVVTQSSTTANESANQFELTGLFEKKGEANGKSYSDGLNAGVSKSMADTLNNAISSKSKSNTNKEFEQAGNEAMDSFIKALEKKKEEARTTIQSMMMDLVFTIRGNHTPFNQAGLYLVQGFADGISANTFLAEATAQYMARAAANAAKKELDEHSPSKVGYQIGDFFGVAFVNALADYASKSYKAGAEIAKSAKSGLSDAISKIAEYIDSDVDTQPTIRPVLDLSNVEHGTARLNTMFNRSQALSISASMNRATEPENQNGTSASAGNNTYNLVQNNYSPKALSRLDIYRQTKNQFSALKEVMGT